MLLSLQRGLQGQASSLLWKVRSHSCIFHAKIETKAQARGPSGGRSDVVDWPIRDRVHWIQLTTARLETSSNLRKQLWVSLGRLQMILRPGGPSVPFLTRSCGQRLEHQMQWSGTPDGCDRNYMLSRTIKLHTRWVPMILWLMNWITFSHVLSQETGCPLRSQWERRHTNCEGPWCEGV